MLLGYYLDIKDYAIIPLGSLVNRRNAFINITNLIRFYGWSLLPNLLTLKRFILFHFQFPFLVCGFRILHLFYLHFHSSNNPLRLNTNNKIPFFPFIFQKDFFGLILILCLYLLETHYGISSFSAGILYVAWRLYPPRWPGLTSSYKRFPLPSSFQLLTECITFYSLPNWDFRIVCEC